MHVTARVVCDFLPDSCRFTDGEHVEEKEYFAWPHLRIRNKVTPSSPLVHKY